MKFQSTRGKAGLCTLSEAIATGLASDGGLFVPVSWPRLNVDSSWAKLSFPAFAEKTIAPFAEGDSLGNALHSICQRAFTFDLPMRSLDATTDVLELFHGPTGSFKDFGARFLALAMNVIPDPRANQRLVLVATSGDTGGAVAGAFAEFSKIPVVILYPKNRISARQEKQLTIWGEQVRAFAVEGTFDDCQRLVKTAMADKDFTQARQIISANSINIARLLPQMAYFAYASVQHLARTGNRAGVIVPSGNVGNATAALWARQIGFPVEKVHFSHNANRAVLEFFRGQPWVPHPTVATLANAMDVGDPSNFERVRWMFPTLEGLRAAASATSTSDSEIRATISQAGKAGEIWCPHTATAIFARPQLPGHWIVAATAHPAKFETTVEPLIGRKIDIPDNLAAMLSKPSVSKPLKPDLKALKSAL